MSLSSTTFSPDYLAQQAAPLERQADPAPAPRAWMDASAGLRLACAAVMGCGGFLLVAWAVGGA